MSVASVASAAVEQDLRDGDKYFEESKWQKAAAAYDRAIDKAPGQVAAEAYGKRAAIFIILKDYKGGLAFIAKAKSRSAALANAPELGEQEALMLWETGRKDEAIAVAEKVVVAKPGTFTNQKLIGEYYASRDPSKSAAAYEAYLSSRPSELEQGDVLPRIRLGFAHLATARQSISNGDEMTAQKMYAKAVDQFETLSRRLGKRPNAQINADNGLCAAYTGLGRFDKALTVCERIVDDPKRVDSGGAVWFNLGTAYLARKQTKKARTAATEFTKLRKTEARGFRLIGDTYFADREWANALDYYLRAEKLLKPNQGYEQVLLSIQLGKTYRRMPGTNNLPLAIEKLDAAYSANPMSTELAIELGGAFLEGKQDAKAATLTDKLLAGKSLEKAPPETKAAVMVIGGKALFNQKKLREARQRFESAQQIRPNDVSIQRNLILTINEQAFVEGARDPKVARELLEQALPIDPQSPVTLTNLAILAIDRGDCDGAQKQLVKLATISGRDEVVRTRLLAKTYMCIPRPDVRKAVEAYANAEREAKKANAAIALAEVYTEWAPLTWDQDIAGAVDKLEIAVSATSTSPELKQQASAAKRNLALALYRHGWKSMREGKATDASSDFERALRDPNVLKGTEPLAFEFSYALSLLDSGRSQEAAKLFKQIAGKGNQSMYLRGPYAKVGAQFFSAYANYRNGPLAARQQAAADLARLGGEGLGGKLDELLASVWELIAYDQWRAGQVGAASKSLATAERYATGEAKRRIQLDKAALTLDKSDLATLEGMNGNPAEALVNLGILYDRANRPKDAYDAWVRAKARGVQSRDLQKWIDAKKRIYGY
ncbi:MAG: tetratricopeptide repeat protein [Kofleriaceae bacterium]